ncbi:MAG: ABC transporter substrate-binding protein [Betaproteobacteria bacterium]
MLLTTRNSCWRRLLVLLALISGQQALHAHEIVVGQILTLTGATGAIGEAMKEGSDACVNWINSNGGAGGGRQLRLVTLDDGGDPARALQLAKSVVEKSGATVLLGPIGPATVASILPWATAERIAVVGPHAGDVGSRSREWDTSYFLTANHSVEGQRLADHLRSLSVSRVSIIRSGDGLGDRALVAFEEALMSAGLQTVDSIVINADGSDAAAAVHRLLDKNPPAIVLATSGRATIAVLQALADARASESFYGVYGLSFAATPQELSALGPHARGLVMTQVLPAVADTQHRLVSIYRAALAMAGSRAASSIGLEGCLGPLVLAEVLGVHPAADASRAAILKAFKTTPLVRIGDFEIPLANHDMPGANFSDIVIIDGHGYVAH